jgi:hypothetical protein
LKGQRYTNLLQFEDRADSVFIVPSGLQMEFDDNRAHTGHTSMRFSGPGGGKFSVKLASLMGDRPFPADWTLGGAYFYADQPAQITVSCQISGKTLAQNRAELPPGQWVPVMVDLSNLSDVQRQASLSGPPALSFAISSPGEVWCDDVLLIDNTQWIVGEESAPGEHFQLRRRGFNYVCETPGKFAITLPTAEALPVAGWHVEQANSMRVRLGSGGKNKMVTIYSDGRSYWDGQYKALSPELKAEPLYAQQQNSPAQIDIPETMGRLERRTPGDENNDGYNEARGAYMLVASGPRMEFTITPGSVPTFHPVLEITGLPAGKPLVTVEGHLVENPLRLEDGTLLIEIPSKIDRPTQVNIRIQ